MTHNYLESNCFLTKRDTPDILKLGMGASSIQSIMCVALLLTLLLPALSVMAQEESTENLESLAIPDSAEEQGAVITQNPVIEYNESAQTKVQSVQPSATKDILWSDDDGIIVIVGSPYIELYTFPSRGHSRFHAIEKYEQIRIFKSRAGWYQIETEDGKRGWTPQKNLHTLYDLEGHLLDFSIHSWDENRDKWQLGLLGGTTDGALSYTIFAGYGFTPNISSELKYTQTFGDNSTIKQVHLMLVHKIFPRWRVTPYFTLGAGIVNTYQYTTLVESPDEQDTAITVGGGIVGYLSHNVLLRIDYNSHTILTTREQNEEVEEWKAGFSVLF